MLRSWTLSCSIQQIQILMFSLSKVKLKIKAKTNTDALVVALLLLPEVVHGTVRFTLLIETNEGERVLVSIELRFLKKTRKEREWGLFGLEKSIAKSRGFQPLATQKIYKQPRPNVAQIKRFTITRSNSSNAYLVSHVTRNGKSRIVAIVRPVRTQMPDVHLNRRVIFARDQAVRPRALSRDVQIDVISVSVDHCFSG